MTVAQLIQQFRQLVDEHPEVSNAPVYFHDVDFPTIHVPACTASVKDFGDGHVVVIEAQA